MRVVFPKPRPNQPRSPRSLDLREAIRRRSDGEPRRLSRVPQRQERNTGEAVIRGSVPKVLLWQRKRHTKWNPPGVSVTKLLVTCRRRNRVIAVWRAALV